MKEDEGVVLDLFGSPNTLSVQIRPGAQRESRPFENLRTRPDTSRVTCMSDSMSAHKVGAALPTQPTS